MAKINENYEIINIAEAINKMESVIQEALAKGENPQTIIDAYSEKLDKEEAFLGRIVTLSVAIFQLPPDIQLNVCVSNVVNSINNNISPEHREEALDTIIKSMREGLALFADPLGSC